VDHEVRNETTRRFIAALRRVETDGDVDGLAALFTDDAEVRSIDGHGPRRGQDGVRELFREYVDQFDRLSTTFTQVTEGEDRAALEWTTEAVRPGGHGVEYTGVTVIDLDGDRCTGFRTVYDSARLMQKVAPA
jgi:ketosteroid isomerase-like protein